MSESLYTEGAYLERNPSWHTEDSPWKAARILKMVRRHRLAPKTICAVGCGAGQVLRHVHEEIGGDVMCDGYEISPQAFALAEALETRTLRFHLENVLDSSIPHFDLVLVIDVIERIEDCFGFLRHLRQKGRKFIFHFPLDMSAQMVARGSSLMRLRHTVGHVHYFMKDTVFALLKDTGYHIDDCFYTPTDLALPSQSLKSAMAKIPRRILYALSPDLTVKLIGGFSLLVLARPLEET